MSRRRSAAGIGLLAGALLAAATACTSEQPVGPTPSASLPPPTVVVDLSGLTADQAEAAQRMVEVYRQSDVVPAGAPRLAYAGVDGGGCAAAAEVAAASAVAVVGPSTSACARLTVPALNAVAGGPVLTVSPTVSDPALTAPPVDGQPSPYAPSGAPSFARVVTTDEQEGAALASYAARNLGVRKCSVVNDGTADSQAVVRTFVDAAELNGLEVLGNDTWTPGALSYVPLFDGIAAKEPDCLLISGAWTDDGARLLRDKIAVLGGQETVRLLASGSFLGSLPGLAAFGAQGAAVPTVGLSLRAIVASSIVAQELVEDYRLQYGELPPDATGLYAVAALQVVELAVAGSDGSPADVTGAVFGGRGVTVTADVSVLGRALSIDPRTGNPDLRDLTVLRVVDDRLALGTPVVLP